MVQQLRCHVSTAGGTGSIPGWGAKILCLTQHGQKIEGGKKRTLPNNVLKTRAYDMEAQKWLHPLTPQIFFRTFNTQGNVFEEIGIHTYIK